MPPNTGRRAESMYVPKRGRKAQKGTPSKSPPRSTSRKSRTKQGKLNTAATEVEYKTPKPKLKRDEFINQSTSKMLTSNKGSRKLVGASSFSRKNKGHRRSQSPLETG